MLRLLIFASLLVAGCSTETETTTVEFYTVPLTPREQADKIEASFLDGFATGPDVLVSSADCPEIEPKAAGEYVCTLVAHGIEFPVDVAMIPELQPDSTSRMKIRTTPRGTLYPADVEAALVRDVRANTGNSIDVACDSPPIRLSTPRDQFACIATNRQDGEQAPLVITIRDDGSGWDAAAGTL